MKLKLILGVIALLLATNGYALGWSKTAQSMLTTYEHPIEDGAVSSIWGNLLPIVDSKFSGHPEATIRKRQVNSPFFKGGVISFLEAWPKDEYFRPKKFVIFNPGVFSPLRGDQTNDFIRRLCGMGYHVIAFANPLDRDFIALNPNFEVGDVYKQAQAIYSASRAIINDYKRAGRVVGKIRWVGVSYGSFLTSILATLDTQNKHPLGTQDITLFSPPFVLTDSISLLDKLILETRDDGYEFSNWSMLKSFWSILWLKGLTRTEANETNLSLEARGILGEYVFKSGMARALRELDELTGLVGVPKKRRERKEWREGLLFSEIFNKFSPKFATSFKTSANNHLSTWIDKLRDRNIGIRILSAKDDFINDHIPSSEFHQGELMQIPAGGHFGYRSLDWFSKLVEDAFAKH